MRARRQSKENHGRQCWEIEVTNRARMREIPERWAVVDLVGNRKLVLENKIIRMYINIIKYQSGINNTTKNSPNALYRFGNLDLLSR